MSKIIFTELGWEDYVYWQSQDKKTIKKINLLLQDINKRIEEKEISLKMTDAAMDFITDSAYDPAYGARPLKRYLQKNVETLLAKKILADEVTVGDVLTLDVSDNQLVITNESNLHRQVFDKKIS